MEDQLWKQLNTQNMAISKLIKDAYEAGYKKRDEEIKKSQTEAVKKDADDLHKISWRIRNRLKSRSVKK